MGDNIMRFFNANYRLIKTLDKAQTKCTAIFSTENSLNIAIIIIKAKQ